MQITGEFHCVVHGEVTVGGHGRGRRVEHGSWISLPLMCLALSASEGVWYKKRPFDVHSVYYYTQKLVGRLGHYF